jgi:hypothetical protein
MSERSFAPSAVSQPVELGKIHTVQSVLEGVERMKTTSGLTHKKLGSERLGSERLGSADRASRATSPAASTVSRHDYRTPADYRMASPASEHSLASRPSPTGPAPLPRSTHPLGTTSRTTSVDYTSSAARTTSAGPARMAGQPAASYPRAAVGAVELDSVWEDNLVRRLEKRVNNKVYSMLMGFVKSQLAEQGGELGGRFDRSDATLFEQGHRLEQLRMEVERMAAAQAAARDGHDSAMGAAAESAAAVADEARAAAKEAADSVVQEREAREQAMAWLRSDVDTVKIDFEAVHSSLGRDKAWWSQHVQNLVDAKIRTEVLAHGALASMVEAEGQRFVATATDIRRAMPLAITTVMG